MALCADLIIAAEDAQIGTPYSRIWGCCLSGMWLYRGLEFVETAGREGVRAATALRDAPFGDYSAAGVERRPDPGHLIGS